jgi:polyhydroxybutyrate depolymerase
MRRVVDQRRSFIDAEGRRAAHSGWIGTLVAGITGLAIAGCGSGGRSGLPSGASAECVGRSGVAGHSVREVQSGGLTRSFRLAVPGSYDGARPTALVFDFHGVLSNAVEQEARSQLTETGAANGFIVVTPDGFENSWNGEVCCSQALAQDIDDVQFVRDMVATIEEEFCVDRRRVYAAGYSNGGLLADVLACRAADLIAAVAVIEAAALDPTVCQATRPVPVIFFHGTTDPVVPYVLGEAAVATWREINACSGDSELTFAQGDSRCETWAECSADATTVLCTIEGGGHVWPGGGDFPAFLGHKTEDLSASEEAWRFFAAHPLPPDR